MHHTRVCGYVLIRNKLLKNIDLLFFCFEFLNQLWKVLVKELSIPPLKSIRHIGCGRSRSARLLFFPQRTAGGGKIIWIGQVDIFQLAHILRRVDVAIFATL